MLLNQSFCFRSVSKRVPDVEALVMSSEEFLAALDRHPGIYRRMLDDMMTKFQVRDGEGAKRKEGEGERGNI